MGRCLLLLVNTKRNRSSNKRMRAHGIALAAVRQRTVHSAPRLLSKKSRNASRQFTTTSTSTTTTTTASTETAAKKEGGGIPWGLILPLGFIGSVVGYFYRGSKNTKLENACRNELKDGQFMSHEELVQVREENKLSLPVFRELCKRAKTHFASSEQVDLRAFFQYCVDQLGGEYQARGGLKASHIFDRLEMALGGKADLDTALCAVSIAVLEDPTDLINALFPVLKDREGDVMSYDKFVEVVTMLDKTNQLPVRVLVKMTKEYPFNKYTRASPQEIADRSLLSLSPNGAKEKEPDKFIQERKKQPLSQEDFLNLLLSTDLCVWGACWQRRK